MGQDGWWDWPADRAKSDDLLRAMSEDGRKVTIESLAERCVVLDNLASNVTVHTVRSALEQFGTVHGVKMLKDPWDMSFYGAAIAEMENKMERDQVVQQVKDYLFMIGAIPRPARAIPATPALLFDHPFRRSLQTLKFVRRSDRGSQSLIERERRQQRKENEDILLQRQMEQEVMKVGLTQESNCRESVEKFQMMSQHCDGGTIAAVKSMYGMLD